MKFIVRFLSGGNTCPIDPKDEDFYGGLNLLDRAREFTGIRDLPPEYVDDHIKFIDAIVVDVEVNEAIARKSGLFATKPTAKVTVPPHSLEKFLAVEPYLDQDKNGMIVRWRFTIQTDEIAKAWIAAGCPAEWDPNE